MTVSFTIFARPTTKKTTSQIISFGKPCYTCQKRPFQKVIPAEIFLEFEDECFKLAPIIRRELESHNVTLPITGPITITAQFFREANIGDYQGYIAALGDVLQEPKWNDRRLIRKGMGIIRDDVQIQHWDGTRLRKDPVQPRIEVTIKKLAPDLFDQEAAS